MKEDKSLHFYKMNGLGNEILIVDLRGQERTLSGLEVKAMAAVPGLHFDQLMVLNNPRSHGTVSFVIIFNSDGTESSACGNGTRCIGWLECQKTGQSEMKFETKAGLISVFVRDIDHITVDMGEPHFHWREIPLSEPREDTRAIDFYFDQEKEPWIHTPSVLNIGNPHAIFWVKNVESCNLAKFGPLLENHPIFPEKANITVAEVQSPQKIKIRTWERGVGLTRACGTAACAAAIAGMRKFSLERTLKVILPGGTLEISWTSANRILMTGSVEHEFDGDWP